jgi:cytochrome c-type biogenesis protein CcmF
VFYSKGFIVVNDILTANKNDNKDLPVVDSAWVSDLSITSNDGRRYTAQPAYFVTNNQPSVKVDTVYTQNLLLTIGNGKDDKIELGIKESDAVMRYITLKAYLFPYINVLWIGTILMVIGFGISIFKRAKH